MSAAKSAAQRKAAERARKAAAGLSEVRGIHAPDALHAPIKAAAAEIVQAGVAPSTLTRAKARTAQPGTRAGVIHTKIPAAANEIMEAFLLRDLAQELGLKELILMRAIRAQGLGDYSVNMALPARVARAMRKHFKSTT